MLTPSQSYASLRERTVAPPARGLDARVAALHGRYHRRRQVGAALSEEADAICGRSDEFASKTDPQLRRFLYDCRARVRRAPDLSDSDLRSDAIAALREAARRKTGLHAYPEQIVGVLALASGKLAEMATGEGKTLVAGLGGALLGWGGEPCHIITVNDYLVRRDAARLAPFYNFVGVRVGTVVGDSTPEERRAAYEANLTYATAKEVLADHLRDGLRAGVLSDPSRVLIRNLIGAARPPSDSHVLRGIHTAIVDEADSILIDEAVTPLIISSPRHNASLVEACNIASEIVVQWVEGTHYTIDLSHREISFSKAGDALLEELRGQLRGLWHSTDRAGELIKQALSAREFYHRGKQYIIEDGKIVIVDEFTGRPMPNRTWAQGTHQAIEAKEELELTDPNETIARRSFQRFFRSYRRLCGMTGTADEAAGELWGTYDLPVITVPTHRQCVRIQRPDRVFLTSEAKWSAIVDYVAAEQATGRPILIGSRSVTASEHLAELLSAVRIFPQVLNATKLADEAEIVRRAGESGRVTIATNMAGRGTDITLGEGVAELGGLLVIATERHESARIDRQLFGRAARQGDPGEAVAFVGLEDELLLRHLAKSHLKSLQRLAKTTPSLAIKLIPRAVRKAQARATARAVAQRRAVLRKDANLDASLAFTAGS